MLGESLLPWASLEGNLDARTLYKMSAHYSVFRQIYHLRRGHRNLGSLHKCVQAFYGNNCHDPRDRIFGMLGLLDASLRSEATVRYDVPVLQVVADNFELLNYSWTGAGLPQKDACKGQKHFCRLSSLVDTVLKVFGGEYYQNADLRIELLTLSKHAAFRSTLQFQLEVHSPEAFTLGSVADSTSQIIPVTFAPTHIHPEIVSQSKIYFVILQKGLGTAEPDTLLLYTDVPPAEGDIFICAGSSCFHVRPAENVTSPILAHLGNESKRVLAVCPAFRDMYRRTYIAPTFRYVDPFEWLANRISDFEAYSNPVFRPTDGTWCSIIDGSALAELVRNEYLLRHIIGDPSDLRVNDEVRDCLWAFEAACHATSIPDLMQIEPKQPSVSIVRDGIQCQGDTIAS